MNLRNLLSVTFVVLALAACKSPEQAALVTYTAANASVDASAGAFNDYRKTHPVDPAIVEHVRQLGLRYQAANLAVRDAAIAAQLFKTANSDVDLAAKQATLAALREDILRLIATVNPKLIH